ncbi:MAG: WD40/YVTN/BNR-like repeat-containing protein [Promethearchaeota archaeon]
MAHPYTLTNGTNANADEVMSNLKYSHIGPYVKVVAYGKGTNILKFSDLIFQTQTHRTTDGGANWTANAVNIEVGATSGQYGIGIDSDTPSISKFTFNSGANWWNSGTDPALDNAYCADMFGEVVVVGGDHSSNRSIYRSTDAGDNYAECSSGPTDKVIGICLASETVGYAVDQYGNIWKTTDGGDNWTDTTDDLGDGKGPLTAIDTDTFLSMGYTVGNVRKYVNSTNTVTQLVDMDFSGFNQLSKFVKADNGNYYAIIGDNDFSYYLIKYDGTNIYTRSIGLLNAQAINNTYNVRPIMIEVNNVLYVSGSRGNIQSFDVSES